MHPAAMRLANDPAKLPDQGNNGVARPREALIDARAVHDAQPSGGGNGVGGVGGNDAKLTLRPRQGGLDVEPRLPAVLQAVKRAYARIGYPRGGWQRVAHGLFPDGSLAWRIAAGGGCGKHPWPD